jgi:hypothetical protein
MWRLAEIMPSSETYSNDRSHGLCYNIVRAVNMVNDTHFFPSVAKLQRFF